MADHTNPDTPVTPPPASPADLQYRKLSPADVAAEMSRNAASVRRALDGYESAKTVSQETLEATVCV